MMLAKATSTDALPMTRIYHIDLSILIYPRDM